MEDVTLQLIGVGFPRTGTDSIRVALDRLGMRCYHMREVLDLRNRGHLDFWCSVAKRPSDREHEWETVYSSYRAAVDAPTACVWRQLVDGYPSAKVLLSLHPDGPDAWFDSTVETIYAPERMWQWKALQALWPRARRFGDMQRLLVWDGLFEGTLDDRIAATRLYTRHIAEVKARVPADRLLVYDVSHGWGPLCDLLDLPKPEAPFPRVNSRAAMRRIIRRWQVGVPAAMALVLVLGVVLLWALASSVAAG